MTQLTDIDIEGGIDEDSYYLLENTGAEDSGRVVEYAPYSGEGDEAEFYKYVYEWDTEAGEYSMKMDDSRTVVHGVEFFVPDHD